MDVDEPGWLLIDDFVREQAEGRSVQTVRRYVRWRGRLVHLLETADLAGCLAPDAWARLAEARRHHDGGAFWAVLGAAELVDCLPLFLQEPWLPATSTEARVHVSLVGRLVGRLRSRGLVDEVAGDGALRVVEDALAAARVRTGG